MPTHRVHSKMDGSNKGAEGFYGTLYRSGGEIMNNEPEKVPFILIPGYIDARPDLTRTEKYIFGLVNGLSHQEGYCYASNYYLADRAGCSESTISRSVSKIEKFGLWRVELTTYTKEDAYKNGDQSPALGTIRRITPFQTGENNSSKLLGGSAPVPRSPQHQCVGLLRTSDEHSIKEKRKREGSKKLPLSDSLLEGYERKHGVKKEAILKLLDKFNERSPVKTLSRFEAWLRDQKWEDFDYHVGSPQYAKYLLTNKYTGF